MRSTSLTQSQRYGLPANRAVSSRNSAWAREISVLAALLLAIAGCGDAVPAAAAGDAKACAPTQDALQDGLTASDAGSTADAGNTLDGNAFANTAPGAPVVTIVPSTPTTLDALTATIVVQAVDIDRKSSELQYVFAWHRDGQPTTQVAATVPAGVAKRGETWRVLVYAWDAHAAGGIAEASVTVDDVAPGAPTVALTTNAADLNSVNLSNDISCAVANAAFDADADDLTYQYQWYVDGVADVAATSAHVGVASLQLDGSDIKAGAKLQCKVTASDGTLWGPAGSSAEVTVLAFDVCASPANPCSTHANCAGTDTLKVTCACKAGYSGDGSACSDVDECTDGTAGCAAAADCANTDGSFTCTCKAGYVGDGKSCADVDECLTANGGCGDAKYIACQNVVGGPALCGDINECASNNGGCGDAKSFTCNNNYAKAQTCGSINSCAGNNGGCGDANYWTCKENAGAAPTCTDIDQCKANNGGCGNAKYTTCTNVIGAPQVCADIDECKTNNGGCGDVKYTSCSNQIGAAQICADIDECKTNNGGCGNVKYTSCSNQIGAAQVCADIDECKTNNGGCGGGLCANNVGAPATCTCSVAKGPAAVNLATAANFVVLAKAAISSVPMSALTGDIAISPAAASYISGFALVTNANKVSATSSQVTGKVYAADYAAPTPGNLTVAVVHMMAAYTDAATRPGPDFVGLGAGNIGGKTLVPGLYKWSNSVIIPTDVVLDGCANDVWIFQISGDLTMASAKKITLTGGAQAKNVFWQTAGSVTIGAAAHFEGTILGKTSITLQTGATMHGRLFGQTLIALQKASVAP